MFRWYVINTYSGHENKVKHNIEHRVSTMEQSSNIRQVVVPTEQVSEMKNGQKVQTEKAEKRRGPIIGFLVSCWAELKRVQWPDRDTLVQALAVTFIFVAVMAAYLGGLDAAFNWLIQRII